MAPWESWEETPGIFYLDEFLEPQGLAGCKGVALQRHLRFQRSVNKQRLGALRRVSGFNTKPCLFISSSSHVVRFRRALRLHVPVSYLVDRVIVYRTAVHCHTVLLSCASVCKRPVCWRMCVNLEKLYSVNCWPLWEQCMAKKGCDVWSSSLFSV